MVHESLGLVEPMPSSSIQLPATEGAVQLEITPLFADDGVMAGNSAEVLRALQHMKKVVPLVRLRFSHLQVATASTDLQTAESFTAFTR